MSTSHYYNRNWLSAFVFLTKLMPTVQQFIEKLMNELYYILTEYFCPWEKHKINKPKLYQILINQNRHNVKISIGWYNILFDRMKLESTICQRKLKKNRYTMCENDYQFDRWQSNSWYWYDRCMHTSCLMFITIYHIKVAIKSNT